MYYKRAWSLPWVQVNSVCSMNVKQKNHLGKMQCCSPKKRFLKHSATGVSGQVVTRTVEVIFLASRFLLSVVETHVYAQNVWTLWFVKYLGFFFLEILLCLWNSKCFHLKITLLKRKTTNTHKQMKKPTNKSRICAWNKLGHEADRIVVRMAASRNSFILESVRLCYCSATTPR